MTHLNRDGVQATAVESELIQRTQAELLRREEELVRQQSILNRLYKDLAEFQRLYQRIITPHKLTLERVRAQINGAQQQLRAVQAYPVAERPSRREQAQASQQRRTALNPSRLQSAQYSPEELKRLYREAVRLVHPDHAVDDADRTVRHQYMVEVNRAYETHDQAWLQNILRELRRRVQQQQGDVNARKYQFLLRAIEQLEEKINAVLIEIESLTLTDVYLLYARYIEAQGQGRDLLEEMAADLQAQIEKAKANGYDILVRLQRQIDVNLFH